MSFLKVFDVKNRSEKKTCLFGQKEKERGEKSFCFLHSNNVIETKE